MTVRTLVAASALAASLLTLAGHAQPAAAASAALLPQGEPNYTKVVADSGPALVTIKYVMAIEAGGQSQEREAEAVGVMIDNNGLVLCAGVDMGAFPGGPRAGLSVTPKKIRVLIGDDTEGVEATLVSRDSEVDLAWVRIDKPADKGYAHLDFAKSAQVAQGERVVLLTRLDKFFDRVIGVADIKVGAIAKKPRTLMVPADPIRTYGRPVFNESGAVVGYTVVQAPSQEEAADENNFRGAICVLPASEVASATERALKNPEGDQPAADKGEKKDAAAPAAPAPAPATPAAEPKK